MHQLGRWYCIQKLLVRNPKGGKLIGTDSGAG
jgi:hypothetical protein